MFFLSLKLCFEDTFARNNKEKLILLWFFAYLFVFLTQLCVEDRLHLEKTQIKFAFSLDLHYLCHRLCMDYYLKHSIRATIHDALDINHLWSVDTSVAIWEDYSFYYNYLKNKLLCH